MYSPGAPGGASRCRVALEIGVGDARVVGESPDRSESGAPLPDRSTHAILCRSDPRIAGQQPFRRATYVHFPLALAMTLDWGKFRKHQRSYGSDGSVCSRGFRRNAAATALEPAQNMPVTPASLSAQSEGGVLTEFALLRRHIRGILWLRRTLIFLISCSPTPLLNRAERIS